MANIGEFTCDRLNRINLSNTRAFTDPEIMDALLLHYIGTQWEVKLKEVLKDVFDSKAWKYRIPPINFKEKELFSDQLPENQGTLSIETKRLDMRKKHFLLGQLADSVKVQHSYDDEYMPSSSLSVKQKLLHLMTTECYLNRTVHSSHAIIRSDFEMFGPSLPHATILAVLKFLGMPKTWLSLPEILARTPSFCWRFLGSSHPRTRGPY